MIMKKLVVAVLVLLIVGAGTAHADTARDDQFLQDLKDSGFNLLPDKQVYAMLYGMTSCVDLLQGVPTGQVRSSLEDVMPPQAAAAMLSAAIDNFCPRVKGTLGT